MLQRIVADTKEFVIVFILIFTGFANIFYLRESRGWNNNADITGEDAEISPRRAIVDIAIGLYHLAFLGDIDGVNIAKTEYDTDLILLVMFIFVSEVVLVNVLFAIVSDSYDVAMADAYEMFWGGKLELIFEIEAIYNIDSFISDSVSIIDFASSIEGILIYSEEQKKSAMESLRKKRVDKFVNEEMLGEAIEVRDGGRVKTVSKRVGTANVFTNMRQTYEMERRIVSRLEKAGAAKGVYSTEQGTSHDGGPETSRVEALKAKIRARHEERKKEDEEDLEAFLDLLSISDASKRSEGL